MTPRRAVAALALAALGWLPLACTSPGDDLPTVQETRASAGAPDDLGLRRYAALGDSYSAAPLNPVTDLARGCLRSDRNYAHRLAQRLAVSLDDVTCSGAKTDAVESPQVVRVPGGGGQERIPPQLDAVTPRTDLVTIGLGGNDSGLFVRLTRACTSGSPQACTTALSSDVLRADFDEVRGAVSDIIDAVRERAAPDVLVVVVGYPRLAPAQGTCAALGVPAESIGDVDRVQRRLDRVLQQAARQSDASYLDLFGASEGHDVCSADPWINGAQTRQGVALSYHPLPVEQQAVAGLLERLVRKERS